MEVAASCGVETADREVGGWSESRRGEVAGAESLSSRRLILITSLGFFLAGLRLVSLSASSPPELLS